MTEDYSKALQEKLPVNSDRDVSLISKSAISQLGSLATGLNDILPSESKTPPYLKKVLPKKEWAKRKKRTRTQKASRAINRK